MSRVRRRGKRTQICRLLVVTLSHVFAVNERFQDLTIRYLDPRSCFPSGRGERRYGSRIHELQKSTLKQIQPDVQGVKPKLLLCVVSSGSGGSRCSSGLSRSHRKVVEP